MKISKNEARAIILSAHDSLHAPLSGSDGVKSLINTLGYIQIDTIHLFMRAHHHTLWNRMVDYNPHWLCELQRDTRNLFEYWSHAASVIPMENFRYCLPKMKGIREKGRFWFEDNKKVSESVLKVITREGPKMARDFKDNDHRGSWWDWKPAKKALQYLQMSGILSVSHREGFAKVYDLTERILPDGVDQGFPSEKEMADFLLLGRLNSEGLLSRKDITYLRRDQVGGVSSRLDELVEERVILKMETEGYGVCYTLSSHLKKAGARVSAPVVRILSPFDNLVILRNRLSSLFNFPFALECYLPAEKRSFGYFAQPILFGDEFVGKIDFKIDGKKVIVRNINITRRGGLTPAFRREWKRIMQARGAEEIVLISDFNKALFNV